MISRRGLFRLAAQGLLAGAAALYCPSVLERPRWHLRHAYGKAFFVCDRAGNPGFREILARRP